MDHQTPFIISAFAIAFVVLAWTALAPVIRGRRLQGQLAKRTPVRDR